MVFMMQETTTFVPETIPMINLSIFGLIFLAIVLGAVSIGVILLYFLLQSRRSVVSPRVNPYPSTYGFDEQEIPKGAMNGNFCPHCGARNRLGVNFCASCGESIV